MNFGHHRLCPLLILLLPIYSATASEKKTDKEKDEADRDPMMSAFAQLKDSLRDLGRDLEPEKNGLRRAIREFNLTRERVKVNLDEYRREMSRISNPFLPMPHFLLPSEKIAVTASPTVASSVSLPPLRFQSIIQSGAREQNPHDRLERMLRNLSGENTNGR